MLALLGVGAVWWVAQTSAPTRLSVPSGPVAQAREQPSPTEAIEIQPGVSGAPASEAERLRQSLERLELEDRLHTAELAEQRKARVLELQRVEQQRLELARKRAEEASVVQAVDEPLAFVQSEQVAQTEPALGEPVLVPVQTVELACAGSSNFFTRDLCRIRECGQAAFASDPTCVRFRQMEEANRRQLAQ